MENQELGDEHTKSIDELKKAGGANLEKKLDMIGWGLFFIWIGIAFLVEFGLGVGLFGVGLIALGVQAARKYLNLKPEGFSGSSSPGIVFILVTIPASSSFLAASFPFPGPISNRI